MNLNRKIAPEFNTIESLNFPAYSYYEDTNKIKLYALRAGNEPVVRIEMVFDAGVTKQKTKGESSFTASMLSEGTSTKTAIELADTLDYYGSYFQVRGGAEDLVATLYCLDTHVESCLPYFFEAILTSIFPEKELKTLKKNAIQKLLVSNKKNSYLCRKSFYQNLLGEEHELAGFSEKEDIEKINREDLLSFYKESILEGFKYSIISGNFSDNSYTKLKESIESSGLIFSTTKKKQTPILTKEGEHFVNRKDSVQSSIRIGGIAINRKHSDFRKLQFLNLILGGYFGSRLMKNIREDKGLTYGIHSVLESYQELGIWYIDCELNYKNRKAGIEEIWKEIGKIKEEEIGIDELENAKNYYLGSFLKSLDGPFSLADRLKIMIDNNLSDSYYPEFVSFLKNTNSKQLLDIANTYLDENKFVKVIVGKE